MLKFEKKIKRDILIVYLLLRKIGDSFTRFSYVKIPYLWLFIQKFVPIKIQYNVY